MTRPTAEAQGPERQPREAQADALQADIDAGRFLHAYDEGYAAGLRHNERRLWRRETGFWLGYFTGIGIVLLLGIVARICS